MLKHCKSIFMHCMCLLVAGSSFTGFSTASFASTSFADEKILPFQSDSLTAIEEQYAEREFLLLMWRSDCIPCRKEFSLIANLQPNLNLPVVVIATDDIAEADLLLDLLRDSALDFESAWAFAESNEMRLRYKIDPTWQGELPRSYLYAKDGTRLTHSGMLKAHHLQPWLSSNSAKTNKPEDKTD